MKEEKGKVTYQELGVVVLEDGRSLLRGRLLCRVARSHAHALVVCCGHGAAGNNASMVMIMTP